VNWNWKPSKNSKLDNDRHNGESVCLPYLSFDGLGELGEKCEILPRFSTPVN